MSDFEEIKFNNLQKVIEKAKLMNLLLIDELLFEKAEIEKQPVNVIFKIRKDENILDIFLGLAKFFNTIVIQKGYVFYVLTTTDISFELHC
ncbi:MAG: hypothetical protein HWN67_16065 [Candidatus Helarchaeota archaeon]|nr:hypothetical protein [Candidatus Helarchaeota archaeon]